MNIWAAEGINFLKIYNIILLHTKANFFELKYFFLIINIKPIRTNI